MKMRIKKGRWYLSIWHEGRMRGFSLDAYEHEIKKAHINLGKILEKLEGGDDPAISKQAFSKLVPQYLESLNGKPVKARYELALRLHVTPYFGDHEIGQITERTVIDFVRHREKSAAVRDTLKKELRVFLDIIKLAYPEFKLPKIEFANKGRTPGRALELDEVLRVQSFVRASSAEFGETYELIYQVMAFTGMDIKEVVNLKWSQIDLANGWIKAERYKTLNQITIPICGRLDAVLRSIKVRPIGGLVFHGVTPQMVSTAILRSFTRAGLKGFGAKSLRHYVASALANAGETQAVISSVLGHSTGSRCTQTYIHAYGSAKKKAFEIFDQKGRIDFENEGVGG